MLLEAAYCQSLKRNAIILQHSSRLTFGCNSFRIEYCKCFPAPLPPCRLPLPCPVATFSTNVRMCYGNLTANILLTLEAPKSCNCNDSLSLPYSLSIALLPLPLLRFSLSLSPSFSLPLSLCTCPPSLSFRAAFFEALF